MSGRRIVADEYAGFAAVYDLFMDNVPYEKWRDRIVELLKEYGIKDGLILDLGCGTGTMTELLAEAGYDMTGVDISEVNRMVKQFNETRKMMKKLPGLMGGGKKGRFRLPF